MQSGFDPPPPPPGGYPPPGNPPGNQAAYPQQQQGQYAQNPYPQNPYAPQQYIPPAPGYVQPMGAYGYMVPTDGKATASLVLGLLSFFCFGPLASIPAIILGLIAKRDIDRAGGALGGGGLAIAGVIIGGLNLVFMLAYLAFFGIAMISAAHSTSGIPTGYPYPTAPFTVTPPPTASTGGITGGTEASTTLHGNIKVVNLGSGRPLQDQLVDLRTAEAADGRVTIVETTAAACTPCKEIESTIDDPLLQRALNNVTLVEVDIDEFGSELAALKMATNGLPFFFKIDSTAHVTDAISGDEWDENTPANEAPVLGAFAKGTLKKRRHPSPVGTSL